LWGRASARSRLQAAPTSPSRYRFGGARPQACRVATRGAAKCVALTAAADREDDPSYIILDFFRSYPSSSAFIGGQICFLHTHESRSNAERIDDANAENLLPVIQILGVQHTRAGARRGDNHQRIPKRKLRLVSLVVRVGIEKVAIVTTLPAFRL